MNENVFAGLTSYGENWNKVAERNFNEAEINAVKTATAVDKPLPNGDYYGPSVCFLMKAGGQKFIPVSKMGRQPIDGETIDLASAKLVTIERSGDGQRIRVEL
jgi:hypothetical protein